MKNYKTKLEQYKERLKERGLYHNYILQSEKENNQLENNAIYKLHQINNFNNRDKINNINTKYNNNNYIKNIINGRQNNNIEINNKNNTNTNNYEMKNNWFNGQLLPNRNKERPRQISLQNFENNGRNILNQRYINYNNCNLNNESIMPSPFNINSKSVQINPIYNRINNEPLYEKKYLNKSNDKIFENKNIFYYNIPYHENNNNINNYNNKLKQEEIITGNNGFIYNIQTVNNLYNELKKNEKLENKLIEEWKNNNNLNFIINKEKEWAKFDNFNIIDELKRIKRKNMDLMNLLITKSKKIKNEKWIFDDTINYYKFFRDKEIENNKNEIVRLKEEIKDKELKIRELEMNT